MSRVWRTSQRGHSCRLVQQRYPDSVGADRTGRHIIVRAGGCGCVDTGHQVGGRSVVGSILDLHDADHIGIEFGDRGDELVFLLPKFECVVGPTAALIRSRPTDRAGTVQRREVVQHVVSAHDQRAADVRRSGTGVDPGEVDRCGRVDFVGTETLAQYTRQDGDRIAGA